MKISYKLLIGCLGILMVVAAIGSFAVHATQSALKQALGQDSVFLAQETMDKVDRYIQSRLEQLQAFSMVLGEDPILSQSNQSFAANQNVQAMIEKRDREWNDVPRKMVVPFMETVIRNDLADKLRRDFERKTFYRQEYGYEVFGETLVANRFGANVAQTQKTTDYAQWDETWWQMARDKGVYVGNLEYDRSAGFRALDLAVGITDAQGRFAGVIKSILNFDAVVSILAHAQGRSSHKTTQFNLFSHDGQCIYESDTLPLNKGLFSVLTTTEANRHPHPRQYQVWHGLNQPEKLVARAHAKGYRDFPGLDWMLVVSHDTDEVFAPAAELGDTLKVLSLIVILFTIGMASLLVLSISIPLQKLKIAVADAAKGILPIQTGIRSRGEIGQLASAFEDMSQELYKSIQRFDAEVVRRMMAQERSNRLNQLKEQLIRPASLSERLHLITDTVVDVLDADFARIWMTKPGDYCERGCTHAEVTDGHHVCQHRDRCLHLMASSGRYTHLDGEVHKRVPFGCYKIGCVAAGNTPGFITNEATTDPRVHNHDWARELDLVSFAGSRILSPAGEPIGVLAYFSQKTVSEDDSAFLEDLASTSGQIIHASQTEQALQENEQRLRGIMESLSLCSMLIDIETHAIVKVNAAAVDLIRQPREDIVGLPCQTYLRSVPDAFYKVNEKTSLNKIEQDLTLTDGSVLPTLMSVIHTEMQGHPYLLASFIDTSNLVMLDEPEHHEIGHM